MTWHLPLPLRTLEGKRQPPISSRTSPTNTADQHPSGLTDCHPSGSSSEAATTLADPTSLFSDFVTFWYVSGWFWPDCPDD